MLTVVRRSAGNLVKFRKTVVSRKNELKGKKMKKIFPETGQNIPLCGCILLVKMVYLYRNNTER